MERTSFPKVAKINNLSIDPRLIVALLERWRPKTHTFHFPTDECIITLEDVSMLLGLRVNGKSIKCDTETSSSVWDDHLGIHPPTIQRKDMFEKIICLGSVMK